MAARICTAAKEGEVLISDSTFRLLRERPCPIEPLPPTFVKGKAEPLLLHRVRWDLV